MSDAGNAADTARAARRRDHLARDLPVYIVARFGLIVVVAGLLVLFRVPLLVAAAIGIVVGLPAGLLLFRRLNQRVTAALATRGAGRAAERAKLRAQLRGEQDPDGVSSVPSVASAPDTAAEQDSHTDAAAERAQQGEHAPGEDVGPTTKPRRGAAE